MYISEMVRDIKIRFVVLNTLKNIIPRQLKSVSL